MSKKVMLFVVEGQSDRFALEGSFHRFFAGSNVVVKCLFFSANGDVTTECGSTIQTIKKRVNKLVLDYTNKEKIKPSDILRIIQITDTDGAYVPDNCIEEMNDDERAIYGNKYIYQDESILAPDKTKVEQRNKQKRENLNVLIGLSFTIINKIKIPYVIYYFSCNLDHFLFSDRNLPESEKIPKARDFDEYCAENESHFVCTMCNPTCSADGKDYNASWEYVKQDCKSLSKYTNVNLILSDGALL